MERLKSRLIALYYFTKRYHVKTPFKLVKYFILRHKRGITYLEFIMIYSKPIDKEKLHSFYTFNEYLEACFKINPKENLKVLRDKSTVITRFPQYLGRECLIEDFEDDVNFLTFAEKHTSFYAKKNFAAAGQGTIVFRDVLTEQDRKRAYQICKNNGLSIIEEFIPQHPILSSIYPQVVNTIRIHTLRTEKGIEIVLLPCLYVPSSGEINSVHTRKKSYQIFIDENTGKLWDKAFSNRSVGEIHYGEICHCDTGTVFAEIHIPFWPQVIEMVKDAAGRIPELSYIGWDVGITPAKPVIIEGNAISGTMRGYQLQWSLLNGGYGLKKEFEAMFSKALKASALR